MTVHVLLFALGSSSVFKMYLKVLKSLAVLQVYNSELLL